MELRLQGEVARGSFALRLDLDLALDGVTALVGASGTGKSTLLRLIAGFEPAAPATVEVDGERWQAREHPRRRSRRIGARWRRSSRSPGCFRT